VALLAGFLFLSSGVPLGVSVAVSPDAIDRGEVQLTPPCEVRAQTGTECSTCGMTRGFCAMSRLRVADAAAYNAGAPWLYLLTLSVFLVSGAALGAVGREARVRGRPSSLVVRRVAALPPRPPPSAR